MNEDIQDDCYRVSEDANAPMVCNDGTSSTGTEGVQGLVGVASILTSIMMIVFFYVKVVRKKKNNFTIVNPYEAPTIENFKGYLTEDKPVLSPLLAQQKEGWYPTPEGDQERYWNGEKWTDEYREHIVIVPEEKISESRLSPEDIAEILAAEEAEVAEKAERPSTAQVSESFKERFLTADPTADKDPMFSKVADCFGELVVESDLSDGAVIALVNNDQEYQFTDADIKTIDSFSQESAGDCVRELVKETGEIEQEPKEKVKK